MKLVISTLIVIIILMLTNRNKNKDYQKSKKMLKCKLSQQTNNNFKTILLQLLNNKSNLISMFMIIVIK